MPTRVADRSRNQQTVPLLVFLLILLVSAATKFAMRGSRELWLDEYYSAYLASLHFGAFWHAAIGDVHPPLYSALLWLWVRLAGQDTSAMRTLSVLLSLPGVIGLYLLARRSLGAWSAVLAATLFAFSPTLYTYSLEVRSYGLFVSVLAFVLLFYWMLSVEQRGSPWIFAAFAFCSAALVFIHYLGVVVLCGVFAHWLTLAGRRREALIRLARAAGLTLVCIAPVLPLLFSQRGRRARLDLALRAGHHAPASLSFGVPDSVAISLRGTASRMLTNVAAIVGVYPARSHLVLALCAVPIVVVLVAVVWLWVVKGDALCRLAGTLAVAVIFGAVLLGGANVRYVLALAPLCALAFARVVEYAAAQRQLRAVSLALALLLLAVYGAGYVHKIETPHGTPWHDVVAEVKQHYQAGDLVVFDVIYGQIPFDYQAQRQLFSPRETGFPLPVRDWWQAQEFQGWGGPVITSSDLDRSLQTITESHPRSVWLVSFETGYYDPHQQLLARLSQLGETETLFQPSSPDTADLEPTLIHVRLR